MTINSTLPDILARIVVQRRERLAETLQSQSFRAGTGNSAPRTVADSAFLARIAEQRGSAVIAEVKMGSPRLGSLEGRFDPLEQARSYARAGAACLSVVVEPDSFFGSYELLAACAKASGLPAIAKDFIVDPLQLQWARDAGAAAILLIAALYDRAELRHYAGLARQLGLTPLIELNDLDDARKLDGDPWELVGVNNRNLRTFQVELESSLSLVRELPAASFKVAESGIAQADDVRRLRQAGFDAYLIGESLLVSGDPERKLRELLS